MKKEQITKQYSLVLILIAAISILVLIATPFIPAFEVDLWVIDGSENGMDYIIDIWDELIYNSQSHVSEYEGETLIQDTVAKSIMRCMVIGLFVLILINICHFFSRIAPRDDAGCIYYMMSIIRGGFIGTAVYFGYCFAIICWQLEWNFKMIFSEDSIMTTQTIWPFVIQLALFVVSLIVYQPWKTAYDRAVAEERAQRKPLSIDEIVAEVDKKYYHASAQTQGVQTAQASSQDAAHTSTSSAHRTVQDEMENLELLKKYKELLDSQIITEEEFQSKKQELLNTPQQVQSPPPPVSVATDEKPVQRVSVVPATPPPSEPEFTSKCVKCRYPLTAFQQVCPKCGTKVGEESLPSRKLGMKWYNLLVYFILFVSAAGNALSAVLYLTGKVYGDYADLIYDKFPQMSIVDLFFGIICLGLSILALVARQQLYWNKKKGPFLVCLIYAINACVGIVYAVLASIVVKELLVTPSIVIMSISQIILVFANRVYFKNRKDVFTY